MTTKQKAGPGDGKLASGSTAKYRDRPTDDGMRGDGADEPNEGSPRLPRQGPSRLAHQTGAPVSDQTDSTEAESKKRP